MSSGFIASVNCAPHSHCFLFLIQILINLLIIPGFLSCSLSHCLLCRYGTLSFVSPYDQCIHGFCGTFDSILYDDVTISIAPHVCALFPPSMSLTAIM